MKRSTLNLSKRSQACSIVRRFAVATTTLLAAAVTVAIHAADANEFKLVRTPGGISPAPVITSVSNTNKDLTINWQAFSSQAPVGSNVVYQILRCPALKGTNTDWNPVASVTNATTLAMAVYGDSGFLKVQQTPAPLYAGAEKCGLCHLDTHDTWLTTRHAGAFQTLKDLQQEKNTSCLSCHTVGYGSPNGFKDEATTPSLAGVQCESCHGPAGAHASRPLDKNRRPVRTLAAEMCGGCHADVHHPTYEEWATSTHALLEIPEEEFADPTNGPPRMLTCGACHSAATRVALLQGVKNMQDNPGTEFSPEIPTTQEAASTSITCAACHDSHAKTGNEAQLRFPLASKVPYSYSTSTNFAANYNSEVQTCAQCHNMRGASWTGTSRPPHGSPQYNILIGNGGYEAGVTNVPQSAHVDVERQCAQCHTHDHSPEVVTAQTPQYMGHDFKPTMQACAPCHDEVGGALLTEAVQANTKQQINEVKALLDQWALTKTPEALRQKYGVLAWEFTNLGGLSTRTTENPTGPTATEQRIIPDGIKQARFNLYLVENDGSYGVHNGNYARFLLKIARDNVNAALQAQ